MALSQILVLVIGIVGISYALGSSMGVVSAAGCTDRVISSTSFCYNGVTYTRPASTSNELKVSDNQYYIWSGIVWKVSPTATYNPDTYLNSLSNAGINGDYVFNWYANQAGITPAFSSSIMRAPPISTTPQTSSSGTQATPPASTTATQPSSPSATGSGAGGSSLGADALNSLKQAGLSAISGGAVDYLKKLGSSLLNPTPKIAETGPPSYINPSGSALGTTGGTSGAADIATKTLSQKIWGAVTKVGNVLFQITAAVGVALAIHEGLNYLIGLIPGYDPNSVGAAWAELGSAVVSGASVGVTLSVTGGAGLNLGATGASALFGLSGVAWLGIGVAVALVAFFVTYKQHTEKAVVFTCLPWQAPLGGSDCTKCGENRLPCSAYQCASLGQACKLLNSDTTGKQLCINGGEGDNIPPIMSFWGDALSRGYSYNPKNVKVTSTSGQQGVVITYDGSSDGAIPTYANLKFGVTTDEPSRCGFATQEIPIKNQTTGEDTFDQLIPMDAGLFEFNHSFTLNTQSVGSVPSADGNMTLYFRCQDGNGNNATAYFVVKFGVSKTDNHSPPHILASDLPDNTPVHFGIGSINATLYIDKPVSECRWSHANEPYTKMTNTADCSGGTTVISQGLNAGRYKCVAHLTGILDRQNNAFYFRCNDTLGDVNNAEPPFTLHLKGTQNLTITSATPNNTLIQSSSPSVKVTLKAITSGGASGDGTSVCYYNDTFDSGSTYYNKYVIFANTSSYQSSQELWLSGDATPINYKIPIRCIDAAGNADYTFLNFSVQTDNTPPNVIRAYNDNGNLDIKTDEAASCVYDITNCDYTFDSGNPFSTIDSITHSAQWISGQTYYIKCKDQFNNQPSSAACSIIVKAS